MSGRRARGTSARQLGRNPRIRGCAPRQLATHARAAAEGGSRLRAIDHHGMRVSIAQAAVVADWRGDERPSTSRAATMYLATNRRAGGPAPTPTTAGDWRGRRGGERAPLTARHERTTPAGWTVVESGWFEAMAAVGYRPFAVGPLLDELGRLVPAGELRPADDELDEPP